MEFSKEKTIDVVGVGNALMDILVEVDDDFLSEHGLTKGEMHLVSEEEASRYLAAIKEIDTREVPGGAAANTARGVAKLGGKAAYFGAIGTSIYGGMYQDALRSEGVQTHLHENSELTGNAITYITPDHERTFTVHLGAAAHLRSEHIDEAVIAAAKVVHLEAFQFEGGTRSMLERVIALAQKHDTLVSLDLNDAALIERNKELFERVVARDIDILFVNETESEAFTGKSAPEEAIAMLREKVSLSILKVGSEGSYVAAAGELVHVPAQPTEVVDTTGAGDLYAAGFLFGITHGHDITKSAELGTRLATHVISKIGVDLEGVGAASFVS